MINLIDYGFMPTMMSEYAEGILARVTAVHKERYELISERGQIYGKLKASVFFNTQSEQYELFPTTGDFVVIQLNPNGDSLILKTFSRGTFFSRRAVVSRLDTKNSGGEQAVAANFDYVFIMSSLNHDFNPRRIERYLTLAWQSGAIPVIVLTKADLVDDYDTQIDDMRRVAVGVDIVAVSTVDGQGLELLNEYIKPRKTIVFLGSSGVGKSCLVNAIAGEAVMAVNTIREDDSKGKHTTTHRQLIMLKSGAMIIDTPGMRELGMFDVSEGIGDAFADVAEYFGGCRFSDCKHNREPGCAVRLAIECGELPEERWQSYLKLKKEARYADDKDAFMRERQERCKAGAIWHRKNKKNGADKR